MPWPVNVWQHTRVSRKFNTDTQLGKVMELRGMSVKALEAASGVSYRTISDYLAGRKEMRPGHRGQMAVALRVNPERLDEPPASPIVPKS